MWEWVARKDGVSSEFEGRGNGKGGMDYMSFRMVFFGRRFQSKFEFSFCPVSLCGVKWRGLKNNIFNVWDDDFPCGVLCTVYWDFGFFFFFRKYWDFWYCCNTAG